MLLAAPHIPAIIKSAPRNRAVGRAESVTGDDVGLLVFVVVDDTKLSAVPRS